MPRREHEAGRLMHEYSLVQALLERVEAEARSHAGAAVERIRVRVGELSGVEVPLFLSAFEMARVATVCAGAELEVVPVAARWECPRCARVVERGAALRCRECHTAARLAEGDEILLERIEMEVA